MDEHADNLASDSEAEEGLDEEEETTEAEEGDEDEEVTEGEEEAIEGEEAPALPEKPTKKTRAELLAEEVEPPRKVVKSKRESVLDFSNVQNLSNFLSKVTLAWPEDNHKYNEKLYNAQTEFQGYPKTYFHATDKEKAVFWHAENFRQQFQFLYPDRRPLFIAPKNECGFQKLFPTYIKPRLLPYPELFYAESCVEYLKDFFNNDFLQPSTDPPKQVRSPFSVLSDRKANCYEHSLILATCLIGAGYKAYVVDGYATKEVTTLCALEDFTDTFQENEDHFKEDLQVKSVERPAFLMSDLEDESLLRDEEIIRPVSAAKYKLNPKKHYVSAYQEMMKEREETKRLIEEEKQREEDLKFEEEHQVPPEVDLLLGFRIHAWVLILPGTRDVTEPFFLEPFTGTKREMTDDAFLGIESVFNHKNYWVNLQNCATGVGDLSYDLEDLECWAKLLPEPVVEKKKVAEESAPGQIQISLDDDEDEEIQVPDMFLEMPVSWTVDMFVTPKEYKMKYPGGTKTFDYNDAMVERAAPYAQPDGMVQKVLKFSVNGSRKASDLLYIDERFDKRQDHLVRRVFKPNGRVIHEYFTKGRPDSLKEHIFVAGKNKPHSPRHLYYYSGWHPDNVAHRQVLPNGLIETFENRKDRLIHRETIFGGVLCITRKEKMNKTEELTLKGKGENSRPRRIVFGIIEKFSRDPSKSASEDIAEKHLMLAHARIRLIFHYGEDNYTRATLEFFKPETSKIRRDVLKFHPDNCHEFHVDQFTPLLNNYKKSVILARLIAEEQRIMDDALRSEDEIFKTVTGRVSENWLHKLDNEPETSLEDAEDVPQTPLEILAVEEEDEDEIADEVLDFASTYLMYGEPRNKGEEIELKRRIMTDAKKRYTRRAENIAICYYEEAKQLKHVMKQGCTGLEMRIAEEENFVDCFQRGLARLHVMEKKMIRYQAKAPRDYCNLLVKVLQHPKLNKFAIRDEIRAKANLRRGDNLKLLEFAYKLKASTRASCCKLDYVFDFSRGTYEEEGDDDSGSDYDDDDDDGGAYQEQTRKLSIKEKEARAHVAKHIALRTPTRK